MSTPGSKSKSRKTKIAGQGKPDALTFAALADGQAPIPAEYETVSGYYEEQGASRGELRLDVDGAAPQMTASGVLVSGLADRLHWVAKVTPTRIPDRWVGDIWFKDGAAALLPHSKVEITATSAIHEGTVRFTGEGLAPAARTYRRKSVSFHPVEFQFDVVAGTTAVTQIDTHAHPNRPGGLPRETLTIETAFRRVGFDVSTMATGAPVPLALAGADGVWTDTEMHDAMQIYWSRFANKAQWALWVLFAARHKEGPSLGGVMFDNIGPNHRQGTAIFNDSFISDPPAGDAAPDAWVRRMRFWCACHEIGHAFNLAHSWEKAIGKQWTPISDEPEARSFMNYPMDVKDGQTAFFQDFAYRFSDQELLFMRHAPERFVQMGNANWFDNHAFEQAETSLEPAFRVELRLNRPAVLEFLEPCLVEIKLTNVTEELKLVNEHALRESERMVIIIKRDGQPARQWAPFAHYCYKGRKTVLEPGASRYESLFVGTGDNGWSLAEPGFYTVQALVRISDVEYVSNALRIRVKPPRSHDEEYWAQDFFSEDVGRLLTFDGSRAPELGRANAVLHEVVARFPQHPVACHARVALARPLRRSGKVLALPGKVHSELDSAADVGGKIELKQAQPDVAQRELSEALVADADKAAETLGHIDYKNYVDDLSASFLADGNKKAAGEVKDTMLAILTARKVAQPVLNEIKAERAKLDQK